MIKRAAIKRKIKYCIEKSLNAKEVNRMVDKIIASGVVNLESADDNWILPKNITCAIARQFYADWAPQKGKRDGKRGKNVHEKAIDNIYTVL